MNKQLESWRSKNRLEYFTIWFVVLQRSETYLEFSRTSLTKIFKKLHQRWGRLNGELQ